MIPRFFCTMLVLFALLSSAHAAGEGVSVSVGERGETFVVEAIVDAPVSPHTAWDVLTDFEHMAGILNNLTSSRVVLHDGNRLVIQQVGVVRYGVFSQAFQVEREIRMTPMRHIHARNISGALKRMESDLMLEADRAGHAHIAYRAEFVFDSVLANMFGATFLQHEIEEQFTLMVAEMRRRESSAAPGVQQVRLRLQ